MGQDPSQGRTAVEAEQPTPVPLSATGGEQCQRDSAVTAEDRGVKTAMKFMFVPISVASGLAAGQLSKKIFDLIWGKIDEEEAPHPKYREIDVRKMALA